MKQPWQVSFHERVAKNYNNATLVTCNPMQQQWQVSSREQSAKNCKNATLVQPNATTVAGKQS
jgi:hypothetical protein